MVKTAEFWDKIAPSYAKQPIKDEARYEATLERVRGHLAPEQHALEIGCGTGSTALLLAPSVASYQATDLSGGMIAIAQQKQATAGLAGLSFSAATVEQVRAPDDGFDVILAFNFLHLVEDLSATLQAVHQRLKPGGLLISKTPCLSGIFCGFWPAIKVMQFVGKAPPVRFFSSKALDRQVEQAGFEIIEADNMAKTPPSHFIAARKISR
jgi:2-polyprenyl-3-methyl-5-hydroxy-6-metoxy-1,4-benzoquinol methylase